MKGETLRTLFYRFPTLHSEEPLPVQGYHYFVQFSAVKFSDVFCFGAFFYLIDYNAILHLAVSNLSVHYLQVQNCRDFCNLATCAGTPILLGCSECINSV